MWKSIVFADNILSKYIAQKGNCAVSQKPLYLGNMECHHINPNYHWKRSNDSYQNLMVITTEVHKLIHVTKQNKIAKYLNLVKPDKKQLEKINKLHVHVGNEPITV